MAIIGLQKESGKKSRVREKSVKSQGILIWIMSGNPVSGHCHFYHSHFYCYVCCYIVEMCLLSLYPFILLPFLYDLIKKKNYLPTYLPKFFR